ncbi:tetratricopeptide repeat protein [Simiduia sp. 21SJ11W-1]|uniref:YfgM family protein n=1 Tax=Simiduia sp. 21SJ11W-1 TaxID=2909669 RepID=UPI0020A208F4|nr:tetratricopeptide repeat protein [Simiduia sp. 21SJ11W-1]UTA49183.1 tetratricopeptide repeat protein [Simiduia sp. 21SJ11W-1]
MSAHLTEEEQIEALKRWWDENGKSLVVAVVLGVGGYMGFNAWQDQRQASAELASSQFEDITELLTAEPQLSDDNAATVSHLASGLKAEHADTLYGINAALLLAKQAIDKGELAQAEAELRWALEQSEAENVSHLVRVRLARVLVAQEKADEALALVNVEEQGAFGSLYAEVKGDAYVAQSENAKAALAYEAALAGLGAQDMARANQIRMKLNSVQASAVNTEEKGA